MNRHPVHILTSVVLLLLLSLSSIGLNLHRVWCKCTGEVKQHLLLEECKKGTSCKKTEAPSSCCRKSQVCQTGQAPQPGEIVFKHWCCETSFEHFSTSEYVAEERALSTEAQPCHCLACSGHAPLVVMHWVLPLHHAPELPALLAASAAPENKAPPLRLSLDPQAHLQIFRC